MIYAAGIATLNRENRVSLRWGAGGLLVHANLDASALHQYKANSPSG